MAIQIRAAETELEARAIYRLRYETYVDELKRVQHFANHQTRSVREPLDESALLYGAYDGDCLIGTVRTNYARSGALGDYPELYQMMRGLSSIHPEHTSITTKLVIAPKYRNSLLPFRLAATAYSRALRDGILFDFIDVYPERVPFFERLGYTVHVPETVHPEYGRVIVMKIATRDVAHLRSVGSPFLRYLEQELRVA